MRTVLTLVGLLAASGCLNDRLYVDPEFAGDGQGFAAHASALLRGDVGEILQIDNSAPDLWLTREERVVEFSGNVPHQSRVDSSVWVDVRVANFHKLDVGEELRQDGLRDTWDTSADDEPALDVYICPNGEGVSGNADDIVVTRTGPESFTFRAVSSDPGQNLDIDLDLVPN